MKKRLKSLAEYLIAMAIIAALMYGAFAVYADTVGHPLKFLSL